MPPTQITEVVAQEGHQVSSGPNKRLSSIAEESQAPDMSGDGVNKYHGGIIACTLQGLMWAKLGAGDSGEVWSRK